MIQSQISLLGELQESVDATLDRFKQEDVVKRLWAKDASLWKDDPIHRKVIQNRLGWLKSVDWLVAEAHHLTHFQKEVRKNGFSHAVLLGMGGSSLAPEVFRQTFGPISGSPRLIVLDSTDPDQILCVEKLVRLTKTLFIVSTKSGTTLETLSLYRYFFEKVKAKKGANAGENFIAITDKDSPLQKEAETLSFFRVFVNPSDVGGRFSVLSYFGMVPAATMGIPVKKLIDRMKQEVDESLPVNSSMSSGASLGLTIGEAWKQGRDKLTIIMSPSIHSYGLWIEQLLAESLGKEGKGIVPIFGETLFGPEGYQNDRLFVYLNCGKKEQKIESKLKELQSAGHPVVRILLKDPLDLGRQFFRWSLAIAIAGIEIGVNPFDEPNVQEAKDWTKKFLDELKTHGKFLDRKPQIKGKRFDITFGVPALKQLNVKGTPSLAGFLQLIRSGDYLNMSAYLPYDAKNEKIFQKIRMKLKSETKTATMFGFGPRYLHSTGQLHKGGPNSCVMILFTADSTGDAPIPGQFFGFGQLEYAQALGDFQALNSKGRRTVHIHLKRPIAKALFAVEKLFDHAMSQLK